MHIISDSFDSVVDYGFYNTKRALSTNHGVGRGRSKRKSFISYKPRNLYKEYEKDPSKIKKNLHLSYKQYSRIMHDMDVYLTTLTLIEIE
ncbi:hypothetical protein AKO1_004298 [Acrasis kona]|uniref:3'-phosphate/5'-hydroxy nucleic acid ligase n=1 Tax=Acrasis kona TaxID=1008807 RepID=A0AAW2YI45_9EUKA